MPKQPGGLGSKTEGEPLSHRGHSKLTSPLASGPNPFLLAQERLSWTPRPPPLLPLPRSQIRACFKANPLLSDSLTAFSFQPNCLFIPGWTKQAVAHLLCLYQPYLGSPILPFNLKMLPATLRRLMCSFLWSFSSKVPAKQSIRAGVPCCHSLTHVSGVALRWHAVLAGVSWDANPSPRSLWGTNLRGGTVYFVACHKQSLPAHYIYIMSCSSGGEITHLFSTTGANEESQLESYKLLQVALMRLIPNRLKQITTY